MPAPGSGYQAGGFKLGEAYMEIRARDLQFHKQLAVVGAGVSGLIGLFTGAAAAAANFERRMAKVNTMLIGARTRYLPGYSKAIQQVAVDFADGTESLSKGLYDILSATVPPALAMDTLRVAAKAGAAGFTTTAIAAKSLLTMLNAYGLSAMDAADVSDWMFEVVRRGMIEYPELAAQLGQAATAMSIAGVSMGELGAAISTVTRVGIPAGRAMTSINGMMTTFLAPTKRAIAVAKKYNLELSTATIRSEGLVGIMGKLRNATDMEVRAIFRTYRGFRAATAILKQYGGFVKDVEEQTKRSGRTQEAFAKASSTFVFKLARMREALKRLAVSFGMVLLPHLKSVVAWVQKLFDKLNELHPAVKKNIVEFTMWAPVVGVVLIMLPKLHKMIGGLIKLLTMPIRSPLTSVIMLLGALAGMKIWEAFGGNIDKMLTTAVNKFSKFMAWIKRTFHDQFVRILVSLRAAWDDFAKLLGKLLDWLVGKMGGLGNAAKQTGSVFEKAFGAVLNAIEWIADGIAFIARHFELLTKIGLNFIHDWWVRLQEFGKNFMSMFSTIAGYVGRVMMVLGRRLMSTFAAVGLAIAKAMGVSLSKIADIANAKSKAWFKEKAEQSRYLFIRTGIALNRETGMFSDETANQKDLTNARIHVKRMAAINEQYKKDIEEITAPDYARIYKEANIKLAKTWSGPWPDSSKILSGLAQIDPKTQAKLDAIAAKRKRLLQELADAEKKRQAERAEAIKLALFQLKIDKAALAVRKAVLGLIGKGNRAAGPLVDIIKRIIFGKNEPGLRAGEGGWGEGGGGGTASPRPDLSFGSMGLGSVRNLRDEVTHGNRVAHVDAGAAIAAVHAVRLAVVKNKGWQ